MKLTIATAFAASMLATGAFAEAHAASGDAAAGEKVFNRCKSCHMINDGANDIVKGGKTGPNLYGIAGRTAGTYEGFNYGDDIVAAGAAGLVWTEADFVAYVQDPKGYLSEKLGTSARAKMAAQRVKEDDLVNLYAYLASLVPAEAATN